MKPLESSLSQLEALGGDDPALPSLDRWDPRGPERGRDGAGVTQRRRVLHSRLSGPDSFINLAPLTAPDGGSAHL
jgi:hypothetical protein